MGNFVILLKKNLIEMVRNKRVLIFSIVFILISAISAVSARFLPEIFTLLLEELDGASGGLYIDKATVADSYVQFIANMGEIAVLLVSIIFVGTIIKEKSKGTYDVLKMNKVNDKEIVLSHFVAQVMLVSISYVLSVAIFVVLNILLFNQIMGVRGFVVLMYVYLLLLFVIAFSLFTSCLCKKSGKAYLIVILGYFGMSILEVIPYINQINPFHLLTVSSELIYYKSYSVKENLITAFSSLFIIISLVVVSLFVVKNKINNKKVDGNDFTERV